MYISRSKKYMIIVALALILLSLYWYAYVKSKDKGATEGQYDNIPKTEETATNSSNDEINSETNDEVNIEELDIDDSLAAETWVPPMQEVSEFNYTVIMEMNKDNYKSITMTIEKSEIPNLQNHVIAIEPLYVEPDFEYLEIEENSDIVMFNLYWYVKEDSGLDELSNSNPTEYQKVAESLANRGVGGL